MQFVFKRDEEGRERVYHGDVAIIIMMGRNKWTFRASPPVGVNVEHIHDAIERADEAGFWESKGDAYYVPTQTWKTMWKRNEVTVDVPVAETSTTLTLVREDD